jgi:nucleotide-binding universal stress UspA family protein
VTAIRRVIVGVSGSPGCLPAVRFAAQVACAHGTPLLPLTAWQPPGGDMAERSHPSPALRELWAEAASRRQQASLMAAFGGLPPDIPIRAQIVRGEAGRSLVEAASEPGDLLVIGTGRRPGLGRVLHAGVGRYCIAHSGCPVLAVPPSPLETELRRFSLRSWTIRHRQLSAADIAAPPPATRT